MRPSATALQYKPTLTFVPGEHYKLSLEVKGTSPTTLSTKVWKASDPEPAAWLGTTTDAAAGDADGWPGGGLRLPVLRCGRTRHVLLPPADGHQGQLIQA